MQIKNGTRPISTKLAYWLWPWKRVRTVSKGKRTVSDNAAACK